MNRELIVPQRCWGKSCVQDVRLYTHTYVSVHSIVVNVISQERCEGMSSYFYLRIG